jgi:hypothetical protein
MKMIALEGPYAIGGTAQSYKIPEDLRESAKLAARSVAALAVGLSYLENLTDAEFMYKDQLTETEIYRDPDTGKYYELIYQEIQISEAQIEVIPVNYEAKYPWVFGTMGVLGTFSGIIGLSVAGYQYIEEKYKEGR